MKSTNHRVIRIGCLVAALALLGCSGYGRIGYRTGGGTRVTLDQLAGEREAYDVYFKESAGRCFAAMAFDAKGDDKTLIPVGWEEVTSERAFSSALSRVHRLRSPDVHVLLGPGGRIFGYLYAARSGRVYVKATDEKVMEVYTRPNPCPTGPGP